MDTYYAELDSIANSLRKVVPENESGRLVVVRSEAVIEGISYTEMQERNLHNFSDNVCEIEWSNANDDIGPVSLSIIFHEKRLQTSFKFTSSGGVYTRMGQLSETLMTVESQLSDEPDVRQNDDTLGLPRPDFRSITSGSISGGFREGLSDREFEYEVLAGLEQFKQ